VVAESVHALGGQAVLERSGHTYIKRTFLEIGAAYAGEMSGHHFFRSIGGDDGLAASLFFARILKESGLPLSRLAASVPSYPITPDIRIPMEAGMIQGLMDGLRSALAAEAAISETDGLRFEFADGWGLVRRSVTEPVLTLRFEGSGEAALRRILQRVEEVCPPLRGRLRA
jgi:phosphomannomutase / phosphoglucomutase